MDCREGYELSANGACVPQLFDTQLFCSIDMTKERPAPLLPACRIVETCSPVIAANQCTDLTRGGETDQCTKREYIDSWGRKRADETNCGQSQPYKITITPQGGKPIELHWDGKDYRADYKNTNGQRIGYIGFSPKLENLYYYNEKTLTSFADMQDGTRVTKKILGKDEFERSFSKDGKVFFHERQDGKGRTEVSNYADGSSLTSRYDKDDNLVKETIKHADGTVTTVQKQKDGSFTGTHTDRHNKVIEDVVLVGDYPMHKPGSDDPDSEYMVFRNRATGSQRAVAMPADIKHDHSAHFQPLAYDGNLGTLALTTKEGTTVLESSQGRTDVKSGNGMLIGSTIRGEQSFLWPDSDKGTKRASVIHADGCGAQLNNDNTIDRWCKDLEDKAIGEKLAAKELEFLKGHSEFVDVRDLTEIHRRFRGDEKQLNQFYDKLSEIDSAKGLTKSEKAALCKNLMHHVAYPDEIVQGRSPTCNVAVLEIEMAKNNPAQYVDFVVDAVSKEGKGSAPYKTTGGKSVRFDENNLKMSDLSGRDLASRIFQTAALQVHFYPRTFKNTVDGDGQFQKGKSHKKFDGLEMRAVAELRYQLTGEETAVLCVTSMADVEKAFELGKGKPMIVSVDANRVPFKKPGEERTDKKGPAAHVVLVNGIEHGPPAKVKISNPWGPGDNASATGSTISGDDLIKNMLYEGDDSIHYGTILIPGKRGSSGTILSGAYKPFEK